MHCSVASEHSTGVSFLSGPLIAVAVNPAGSLSAMIDRVFAAVDRRVAEVADDDEDAAFALRAEGSSAAFQS